MGCYRSRSSTRTTPARQFWTPGPGEFLRLLNHHINYRLTKQADDINYNRPIGVITGSNPDFTLPQDRVAGEFKVIPSRTNAAGDGPAVTASYVVCDLGYLETDWTDLNNYLGHSLEMIGLPESAIRMEQASASSGAQVIAEQIPLIEWAEGRQRPFTIYEHRLARLCLNVALHHAVGNDLPDLEGLSVEQLAEALADFDFAIRWPDLRKPMPGPERDQTDQFRIDNRLASRTQLLMEHDNLTRDQAEARLKETAKDLQREQTLFKPLDQLGTFPSDSQTTPSADNEQAQDTES